MIFVWLTSLSVISYRSIRGAADSIVSFHFVTNVPLCLPFFFVHSSVDGN